MPTVRVCNIPRRDADRRLDPIEYTMIYYMVSAYHVYIGSYSVFGKQNIVIIPRLPLSCLSKHIFPSYTIL